MHRPSVKDSFKSSVSSQKDEPSIRSPSQNTLLSERAVKPRTSTQQQRPLTNSQPASSTASNHQKDRDVTSPTNAPKSEKPDAAKDSRRVSETAPGNYNRGGDSLDSGEMKLEKSINLFSGVTVIVGSIIGSGIFVSPTGVLVNTGSVGLSLIVWVICGVFSGCGAYCYAELGTMFKLSGGDYAYVLKAFGPFCAFLRMWIECIVVKPVLTAIQGLTFAQYILTPFFMGCAVPESSIKLLAACCVLLLTIINCASVKVATRVQDISTIAKTLALVIIIISGIVKLAQGSVASFDNLFENTIAVPVTAGTVSTAIYNGLFAYIGWNYLNIIVEEFQTPDKNLPRAIFLSLLICTVLYLLTNVAYLTGISPQEMIDSPAVAVTFARNVFGKAAWIAPIFVAMSTFGGANGNLLTTSRMYFVSAREGHLPLIMAGVQTKFRTPFPSVAVMGIIACLYTQVGDVFVLIGYLSFVQWFAIAASVVALLTFRYTYPDMHRPLKIGLIWPILYLIMSVFILLVPLITSPQSVGFGILMVLTGVPIYIIFVLWQPPQLTRLSARLTKLLQKICVIYPDMDKLRTE